MSIIDEKFDILSIGKYINKDKEDMMRITAIKNEKGFLAELADNVSNVKGKIIDITKDPRSIFHYVNKTGFN
jgi:fibrillarin-like rRNA methylase